MIMFHRHHIRAEKKEWETEKNMNRNKYTGQDDQCNDWKKN